MKKTLISIALLIILSNAFGQSVSDIKARVVDDKIQIEYSISGLKYFQEVTKVRLFVSMDGGEYKGPLKQITGDDPIELTNGKHVIIWDAIQEIPFTDENLDFNIKLTYDDKDRSRKLFVAYVGNDVTPIGLRVGMLGKTSWYVEVRGSLLAMNSPSYTYTNEAGITDYDKSGYYEFTGTGGWQAYSAIVGVTQQVMWNMFVYAGVGYGVENYILEINNYDYNEPNSTGTDWAKNDEFSNTGVEIDAGIMYRYKKVLFSAGGTALNFKSFGWSASLGYSF